MSKGKRGGHASKFYRDVDTEPDYVKAREIDRQINNEKRNYRKDFRN